MNQLFIPEKTTILTAAEAAEALYLAWLTMMKRKPSKETLAILYAQTAFETGKFTSMRNFNWGNVRKVISPDDGHTYTQYECSEYVGAELEKYYPPDVRCNFRAYSSAASGALDYLITLSQKKRYTLAWQILQNNEGIERFVHFLKVGDGTAGSGGYFTDKEGHYLHGVKVHYDDFMNKNYFIIPVSIPPVEPSPPAVPIKLPTLHKLWIPSGVSFITTIKKIMMKIFNMLH